MFKYFKMTQTTNLKLIQYKILHRTHYTELSMFKMGLTHCNTCLHCMGNAPDHYLHAFWEVLDKVAGEREVCISLLRLLPPRPKTDKRQMNGWKEVCENLSVRLGCTVAASPSSVCSETSLKLVRSHALCFMLLTCLCIAKETILTNWKTKKSLSLSQNSNLLFDHISMVRMSIERTLLPLFLPLTAAWSRCSAATAPPHCLPVYIRCHT